MINLPKRCSELTTRILVSLTVILLSFLLLSCSSENRVFKIGVIVDKGGASWDSKVNAISLAIEEHNLNITETSNKKKIHFELIVEDSGESAENAMDMARELVYQKKVNAIIGPNTTRAALPVSVIAENTEIVMISDGSTHPSTTRDKRFVFRVVPTDLQLVNSVKNHIQDSNLKKVAIIYDKTNVYSRSVANLFQDKNKNNSLHLMLLEYTPSEKQFEQIIKEIGDSFDAIVLPNFVKDLEVQLPLISRHNINSNLYVLDTWDLKLQKLLNTQQDVYITGVTHPLFLSESTEAKQFITNYQHKFGTPPDKSSAVSYDAAKLLINAVLNTEELQPAQLRESISNIRYQGLIGSIEFNEQGDLARGVSLYRVTQQGIEAVNN